MGRTQLTRKLVISTFALLALVPLSACSSSSLNSSTESGVKAPERLRPEIISTQPFDNTSFTQGIEMDGDDLIVGTGFYGEGRIYRGPVGRTPTVEKHLPDNQFGEGITRSGDHIWQLTWKDGVAYKRDARTLEVIDQSRYSGEGWGVCATDDHLVMSDGTSTLRILDPHTFAERRRIEVRDNRGPVDKINELECVGEDVYANRFMTTDIYRINPQGEVTALIDASGLPNRAPRDPNNVLNGIASIPGTDHFYLTGKRWPDLYEVRFVTAN